MKLHGVIFAIVVGLAASASAQPIIDRVDTKAASKAKTAAGDSEAGDVGSGATAEPAPPLEPEDAVMVKPTATPVQPVAVRAPKSLAPVTGLQAGPEDNDDGHHIVLTWKAVDLKATLPDAGDDAKVAYWVLRSQAVDVGDPPQITTKTKVGEQLGRWQVIAKVSDAKLTDDVTAEVKVDSKKPDVIWRRGPDGGATTDSLGAKKPHATADKPAKFATRDGYRYAVVTTIQNDDALLAVSAPAMSKRAYPEAGLFHSKRYLHLAFIVGMGVAFFVFFRIAKKRGKDIFIRRIAGIDAIEDSIGRSTEMGRPVLYVTGTDDMQDMQTIASLLVLGPVAEKVADYDTEMKVVNYFPMTMVVAEEIVRQGFANAGRLDAHKPENVMFISSEQFAFAAGINGIILRDKPATNIYLGKFFAESLILAETGFVTGAVQIAGTAATHQLPFFVASCDYTIIGEELFAVSSYLSRDPDQLASLKATDVVKIAAISLIVLGALIHTFVDADAVFELLNLQ